MKFFVYGTLKVGGRLSYQFNESRISVAEGTTPGSLFMVRGCWFPAAYFNDTSKVVCGEVHEYSDPKEAMRRFTRIESSMYAAKTVDVTLKDGSVVKAIAWEWKDTKSSLGKRIKNGNFDRMEVENDPDY